LKNNKNKNKNNNTTKSSITEIRSKLKRTMSIGSITTTLPNNSKSYRTSTKTEPWKLRRKRRKKEMRVKREIMKLFR
jgi:hypothetical protein